MVKGFGVLEMLVALSLGLGLLTVIIAHSADSARVGKKITASQERLEAIFHTVDTIKSDLNRCGMRLQEARQFLAVAPFASSSAGFVCSYGIADEPLLEGAARGQLALKIAVNEISPG
jgi:type II secretory pathway component PulJ